MGDDGISAIRAEAETSERLIPQRVRILLGIIIASNIVFGLNDFRLGNDVFPDLIAIKVVQLIAAAAAFVALRLWPQRHATIPIGMASVGLSVVCSGLSGVLIGDGLSSLILGLVGNMVCCVLIPWGPLPQLAVASWVGFGIAVTMRLVTGNFDFLDSYIPAAVVVALALPVYMAQEMRRSRRETALANEALRRSEQQFRSLSDSAPIGIFLADKEGRRLYTNGRWQQITGLDLAASLGDGWRRAIHPDDFDGVVARWSDCIRSQTELSHEFRFVRPDGQVRWVHGRTAPLRDVNGTVVGFVGTTEDITNRRQTEEELHATQEWLHLAVENSNIGIWDWDLLTNHTVYSDTWRRQLGYDPGDLDDSWEDWTKLVHPEDRKAVSTKVVQHLRNGDSRYDVELRLRHKRGDYRWILSRATILRDENGSAYRILGLHLDITERKRNEELLEATNAELRRAMDAAQAASRAKSEFLATMSHEIRTPMNGILGMTGLLLDSPLSAQQRSYLDAVRSSANSLLAIINDILDFSKVEAGRLELESVDFGIRSVVEESIDLFAESAQRKGLEIAVFIGHEVPPTLRGDPGRFRQVLTNLLSNAVKFTESGEIVVRVNIDSQDAHGVVVRTAVADTGIGIATEHLPRLFQAFTQADASTTRRYGGTGLGLAICKRLTELMDGKIFAKSDPGRGSTFVFTARFERTPEETISLSRDFTGVRILVVDDNATNRTILAEQLSPTGALVTTTSSGREALTALRTAAAAAAFRLAILDMQMSEMDGLELARSIRAQPEIANTQLMLLTSITQPATTSVLRDAGIAVCLTKPAHRSSLYDAIAATLSGVTMADAAAESRPTLPSHSRGTPAGRVLVVEDNAINQIVAMRLLERLGYRSDAVGNGKEALDALAQIPYDAVLMDCLMPEMDGFEATRHIRSREPQGQHLPIIALTATAMPGDRERCLVAGMDDYIPKPVQEVDLKRALERWLGAASNTTEPVEAPGSSRGPGADDLLRRFGGDAGLLATVAHVFLDDSARLIADVQSAVQQRDMARLKQAAHKLRGALGNFGADAAVRMARDLELWGDQTEIKGAQPSLEPLIGEIETLCSVLRTLPQPDSEVRSAG
ncbi:MAG: response regulator [Deltaproteobacteria bacterium]|nr:response regulator [Deltaproteobacteria bacterium]